MICFSTTEEKLSSNGGKMLKSCVLFKEKKSIFLEWGVTHNLVTVFNRLNEGHEKLSQF